ncbi:solute carrier family 26 member 10 isoform X8 [Rhinopithecus roxellana]|uniref:solute carrier family 26 member 10 isoform X8 n=1 Tax=Rhinopithecus roxellana TaxID=61622 RepID=UPI00123762C0|nr:solute carrier family 26 member 10 isoform X8 [Rhinopithecus roxellana]
MSGIQGTRTYPGAGDTSDLKYPLGTRLREALTEVRFHQLFGGEEQEPELPAERRFPRLFGLWRLRARACSGTGAWRLLLARLPPLHWLPHYRWRAWLLGDAVAGVTVGIVHVPQGMAFALLASVPPVFGLYTSFFPVLIYSLLGTGRHLSTDAGRRADCAAPEQSGRTDHLGAQPGAARAGQGIEREIPRPVTHADPGGSRHGASGLHALLCLFSGHKIPCPDSGVVAWRLAGLFSCIVVLSVLLWLGPFFYYLPKAVLACINISSMRQMFFQMQELPQLWHISRVDFAVWMVTWVAVVTLNVDLGLAVGVVFSMMTVVCRTRRVQCLALGQAEGTELYRPLRGSHKLLQVPGLCILSYPTPLYFGTRGQFRRNLEWHLGLGEEKETSKPDGPTVAVAEPVRVVVLDFSGVTFADAAGAREVVQLASRCRDARIRLLLAQCNASVLGTLTRAGLLDRVTPDQLFVSVQDAAAYALGSLVRGSSTRSESREALGCGK